MPDNIWERLIAAAKVAAGQKGTDDSLQSLSQKARSQASEGVPVPAKETDYSVTSYQGESDPASMAYAQALLEAKRAAKGLRTPEVENPRALEIQHPIEAKEAVIRPYSESLSLELTPDGKYVQGSEGGSGVTVPADTPISQYLEMLRKQRLKAQRDEAIRQSLTKGN